MDDFDFDACVADLTAPPDDAPPELAPWTPYVPTPQDIAEFCACSVKVDEIK